MKRRKFLKILGVGACIPFIKAPVEASDEFNVIPNYTNNVRSNSDSLIAKYNFEGDGEYINTDWVPKESDAFSVECVYINKNIKNIKVYDRALTVEEIMKDYNDTIGW